MKRLPAQFAQLRAVAAAVVDAKGVLLEANAGFIRLLPPGKHAPIGRKVSRFFVQPGFATLCASPGYGGLLTLGDPTGKSRTLVGTVSPESGGIVVIAECDIEEIERVNEAILALNSEASTARRSLTHDNLAMKQREVKILEASLTDELTGVGNRRMLDKALKLEIGRARRKASPLGVMMADLDFFKRINDGHGHAAGDAVLARFGELLKAAVRPTDIVTRFGGEEFAVLLPHTALPEVVLAAERIRARLAAEIIAPLAQPVTCSFGVAQLHPADDAASLLARADAALYQAKRAGRNRVMASV